MDVDGEILRPGQDHRFSVGSGACSWTRGEQSGPNPNPNLARGLAGLTGDRQLGLLAVARVGHVGGDTAKQTAVCLLNARDLQHAGRQQRVPAGVQVSCGEAGPGSVCVCVCVWLGESLPGVRRAQWASVFLPGDCGFWDSVNVTGEPGHAPLPYNQRLRVRQELGESWRGEQTDRQVSTSRACVCQGRSCHLQARRTRALRLISIP